MLPRSRNAILIEEYEKAFDVKIEVPDSLIDNTFTFEIMDTPIRFGLEKKGDVRKELEKILSEDELEKLLGCSLSEAESLTESMHEFHNANKKPNKQNHITSFFNWIRDTLSPKSTKADKQSDKKVDVVLSAECVDEKALLAIWSHNHQKTFAQISNGHSFYIIDKEKQAEIDKFMRPLIQALDRKSEQFIEDEKKYYQITSSYAEFVNSKNTLLQELQNAGHAKEEAQFIITSTTLMYFKEFGKNSTALKQKLKNDGLTENEASKKINAMKPQLTPVMIFVDIKEKMQAKKNQTSDKDSDANNKASLNID